MNGDGGAIPRPEKQNSKFKILWGMVKFHTGSIVCEHKFGKAELCRSGAIPEPTVTATPAKREVPESPDEKRKNKRP